MSGAKRKTLPVDRIVPLLPPLFLLFLVTALTPWWNCFTYDHDEGINLMKAMLVERGFFLYGEIWSDQPPFFTWLLAGILTAVGPSVAVARGLVLAFSMLLLWSFACILQRLEGKITALLACFFLIGSTFYIKCSVAVMIGLPAVSLALVALDRLLAWQIEGRPWQGVFSALTMGLSLQIKLFTFMLVPAWFFALACAKNAQPVRQSRRWLNLGGWIGAVAAVWLAITIASGAAFWQQLLDPHVGQPTTKAFAADDGIWKIGYWFFFNLSFVLVAPFSLRLLREENRWRRQVPLIWLLTATFCYWFHQPVWYHHFLMFSLPASWLAGVAGAYLLRLARGKGPARYEAQTDWARRGTRIAAAGILFVAVVGVVGEIARQQSASEYLRSDRQRQFAALLAARKQRTEWVMADMLMDAFYADLPVPPELAVYSTKRRRSGQLSEAMIVKVLERYCPEQVLLRRYPPGKEVLEYLHENYRRIGADFRWGHYVLPPMTGAGGDRPSESEELPPVRPGE